MVKKVEEAGADKAQAGADKREQLTITPPNIATVLLTIVGTAPLVLNRFGRKAMEMMKANQEAGSQSKKGRKKEPKDFARCYEEAKHVAHDGWLGFHAGGLRTAMVDACRLVGFKMTHAKLGVFVEADGYDRVDGTPLVKITKGEPRSFEAPVKNDSGVADIRIRPMWEPGWEADVRVRFDADMFKAAEVANLLSRVGEQVGIGEGRANSKDSTGCGWGHFRLANR